jgi:hypothetical protein
MKTDEKINTIRNVNCAKFSSFEIKTVLPLNTGIASQYVLNQMITVDFFISIKKIR